MFITIPIHSGWIRPDTTLCNSRHDKQAWMSRHIRDETTPTHASGFHLFTVAMTGHAKDKGVQLPQQVTEESCCPNAVKESRSGRVGMYRNAQGGFACLTLLKIVQLFIGVIESSSKPRLSRGENYRQTKRNTINAMQQLWCMIMSWQYAVDWANATSSKLNEVGLNPRFKFKLHMWRFKCHYMIWPKQQS